MPRGSAGEWRPTATDGEASRLDRTQAVWRSAVSDKVAGAVGGAMSPLALPPRRALMVEVLVSSSV
jgi:hypothetical protein